MMIIALIAQSIVIIVLCVIHYMERRALTRTLLASGMPNRIARVYENGIEHVDIAQRKGPVA